MIIFIFIEICFPLFYTKNIDKTSRKAGISMKRLSKEEFQRIRQWVYLFARHLDITRWQYWFENGSREAVADALMVYQNPDGGFGHGLEPDNMNPNSSPFPTFMAWEILQEIGCDSKDYPMIQDIMRYLENCEYVTDKGCYWAIPSNNEYPCQLWYHFPHRPRFQDVWPPEAYCNSGLVNFILQYYGKDSPMYQKMLRIIDYRISFLPQLPVFLKAAEYDVEHSMEANDWQHLICLLDRHGPRSHEECQRLNDLLLELLKASPYPHVRDDIERRIDSGVPNDDPPSWEDLDRIVDRLSHGQSWNQDGLRCQEAECEQRMSEMNAGGLWWPINDAIRDLRLLKEAGRIEE